MPSLFERLGRTLSRKKSEDTPSKSTERPSSTTTELDGKYESISATEARAAPVEDFPIQEKSKPFQKRLARAKSPSARPVPTPRVPVLSLHLPELNDAAAAQALRLTFDATEIDPVLTPAAIARHRLTPQETVYLAKQSSGALHGKGLATLGIFKPHWHSASQNQQRKLITLFLQSISNTTTLPPPPSQSLEKFEAHLQTASPHDVADVLKWGLRHLQLENQSFPLAISSDEWGWYKTFAEAEHVAGFPSTAYTDLLLPLLPPAHQELLSTFLDIGTSVAAHAEANGVSGSRLTRLVGWWLLSQRKPASNGLVGFIQEWETAARILEHIYLAYIRDHARAGKMPKRLTQLVKSYPYPKQASLTDHHFLPRPKFTTRRRTALFVRVSSFSKDKTIYRNHPIQLLQDALRADVDKENSPKELLDVWEDLKALADHDNAAAEGTPVAATLTLSALLTEEAIRLLTSTGGDGAVFASPPLPVAPSETSLPLRQPESSGTSRAPSDWDGFTNAGFEFMGGLNLAGGLQEYAPPPTSTSPGKTKRRSLELGRRASLPGKPVPAAAANSDAQHGAAHATKPSIVSETVASTLFLDEALIDGWADTLTDPVISSAWPTFVLYHLKTPLADPTATANDSETGEQDPATISWLVIETYAPAPTPTRRDTANSKEKEKTRERRSSSRPRFGAFFSSATSVGTKDKDKDKEGKKKEKEKETSSAPGRKSSIGVLKEAARSQHSLVNQTIVEEEVPPVPKASAGYGAVPSAAAATTGVIAAAVEEAEYTQRAAQDEEEKLAREAEERAAEEARVKALLEEQRLAELVAQEEEERLAREAEERAAEEARVELLEEQRLAELAAQEEEERLAREAAERAAAEKALEEELAAKAEAERLEHERAQQARLEELRLQQLREAEELERQAQLKREEEARQAEAARLEQERLEAEAAAEKARAEEELERERVRKEEEEREAARLEAIRVAEEKLREEEAAAAAASLASQQNDEGAQEGAEA